MKSLRILVVDDVEANLELMEIILSQEGHTAVTCGSGAEALALLARDPAFDIVLLDVQMPNMDGLETTRRIRSLPTQVARVPVVALSANAMADQVAACAAAGMDGHLGKPVNRAALTATLTRVGQNSRLMDLATGRDDPAGTASPQDALEALKRRYRERLSHLPGEIAALMAQPAPARWRELEKLAHQIAGAAGSFGFDAVSDAAFALETALQETGQDESSDAVDRAISRLVEASGEDPVS